MFKFNSEPGISLLTATRTGQWSLDTVLLYELALRRELTKLQGPGRTTGFIVDIRSTQPQSKEVAEALRSMIARLGPLHADRTAVVTSSGIAKLQARRVADPTAEVFTSMVLARDWVMGRSDPARAPDKVFDKPSDAEVAGRSVRIHGPADVDITLTPVAALETAKRIGDAAVEVLLSTAATRANDENR